MAFEQNYVSGAVSIVTNQSLLLEVIVLGSLISKYAIDSLHTREILMREMKTRTCITFTALLHPVILKWKDRMGMGWGWLLCLQHNSRHRPDHDNTIQS